MKITKLLCLSILIFAMFSFTQQSGMISAETVSPANSATLNNIRVPIGVQSFKIEVSENGIYEITQPELVAAGMNAAAVNPNNLQMMSDGSPVSFEFVGDSDNSFEPTEAIRFYGWEFDRSRKDTWFVEENVYWLWVGNNPFRINELDLNVNLPDVTQLSHTQLFEENQAVITGLVMSDLVNGFDLWQWDEFKSTQSAIQSVEIHNPAPAGTVDIQAEIFFGGPSAIPMDVELNGVSLGESNQADGYNSFYYSASTPISTLNNGSNQFEFISTSGFSRFYLNQIEVTYPRNLIMVNDQLTFVTENAGGFDYLIDGVGTANSAEIIAWDITDRNHPVSYQTYPSDLSSGSPNLLNFSYDGSSGSTVHVTTKSQVKTVGSINSYTAADQNPINGAEWLSIAHPSFIGEANRLANHRASTNNITTHVADWEEIKNQYGFGFGTPSAIQTYLTEALANWSVPPTYLVIAGNSTLNPTQRLCIDHCGGNDWSSEPTFVPTDIQFVDRFIGIIPSDYPYMTLSDQTGPILVMTSRLPASSVTELSTMIDKIITYDSAVQTEAVWLNNSLFLADDPDFGGNYCSISTDMADDIIPTTANPTIYCYGSTTYPLGDVDRLRTDFLADLSQNSAGFTHYVGRSSIIGWGSVILTPDDLAALNNQGKPTIVLSGTSLDSYFAYPSVSMAESMMALDNDRGAAAYLGHSGLNYTTETNFLQEKFYESYDQVDVFTIGDFTESGLEMYRDSGLYDPSVLFMHNLFGDAGMLIKPKPDTPTAVILQSSETIGQISHPTVVLVTLILVIPTLIVLPRLVRPTTISQ